MAAQTYSSLMVLVEFCHRFLAWALAMLSVSTREDTLIDYDESSTYVCPSSHLGNFDTLKRGET